MVDCLVGLLESQTQRKCVSRFLIKRYLGRLLGGPLGIPNATQMCVAFFNQGKAVGKAVGNAVGNSVGKAVGNVVGNAVGNVVGNAVGNVVGNAVGNVTHV